MEVKKSKKASLESKRLMFFKLGLLFSLVVVFCSFEWMFYGLEISKLGEIDWDDEVFVETEINQIVIPQKKKASLPKPKVKLLDLSKKIEVLENDAVIVDEVFTMDDLDGLDFGMDEEEQESGGFGDLKLDGLFKSQELSNNPKFGKRETDLDRYIKSSLNLSSTGIYGSYEVKVLFVVEKDGSISDIKLKDTKGLPYSTLVNIQKMFEKMPKWSPGKFGSIPVRCQLVKPINIVFEG
jgi:protein TonB